MLIKVVYLLLLVIEIMGEKTNKSELISKLTQSIQLSTFSESYKKKFGGKAFNRYHRDDYHFNTTALTNIIQDSVIFLVQNTNDSVLISIMEDDNNKGCFDSISKLMAGVLDVMEIINNSGKSMNDLGLQNECEKDGNFSYIFVQFDFNNSFLDNHEFRDIIEFTDQKTFFLGLCMVKSCEYFIKSYFNATKNIEFFDLLRKEGILNVNIYGVHSELDIEVMSLDFIIYMIIIVIYTTLRIIISLFGRIYYSEYFSEKKSEESRNIQDNDSIFESLRSVRIHPTMDNGNNKSNFDPKTNSPWYNFYKFFSIRSALKNLYKDKNYIFDSSNLHVVDGIKIIFMFLFVYNHNYFTLDLIPNRFVGNYLFFESVWFCLVKLSSFSLDALIILSGFNFSFKYFNFMKNHYQTPKLTAHLVFFGKILTRIFSFYLLFFINYLSIDDLGMLFGKGSFFDFIFHTKVANRQCFKNPEFAIIPFFFNYLSNGEDTSACYRFYVYYSSELGCVIITLLLFYVLTGFKSKKLDCILSLLLVAISISATFWLSFKIVNNPIYTIEVIYGDNRTYERVELIYVSYFCGVLGGIIYFYYCDVICENPYKEESNYLPFTFCIRIMEWIDQISNFVRYFVIFLSIVIIYLLCSVFTLYLYFVNENGLNMKLDDLHKFLFIYEKKIFSLFFTIILLFLIINSRSPYSSFFNSNWTNMLSRVGFMFVGMVHSNTYLFYAIYDMEIYMNYSNLFLLTIGQFNYIFFLSIVAVVLYELPFRIAYKKFSSKFLDKKKESESL